MVSRVGDEVCKHQVVLFRRGDLSNPVIVVIVSRGRETALTSSALSRRNASINNPLSNMRQGFLLNI